MTLRLCLAVPGIAAVVALGCADFPRVNPYDPDAPFVIDLEGPALIEVGDTVTFTAETTPRWTRPEAPEWSSNDVRILYPLGGGRYVARGGGTTTIGVRYGPRIATQAIAIESEAPTITSLTPQRVRADTGEITLIVGGTGFHTRTVVSWDGSPRLTELIAPNTLAVVLPALDVSRIGTHEVVAINGTPGGGSSAPAIFESVAPPRPARIP